MSEEPMMEPEVLAAEMRQMGCPYELLDSRTPIWLDGYRAGTRSAGQLAIAAARDGINQRREP